MLHSPHDSPVSTFQSPIEPKCLTTSEVFMVHSPYPYCTTNSPRFKIITSSIQETLQVPRSIVFHSTRDHKVQNNYNPASHTCTNKIQSPKRNYVSQNMSIATGTVHVSWRLTTTMQTTKNGSIITGLYLHNMHEKNKDLFQQILHMPISEQLINLFANIVILDSNIIVAYI